MQVTALHVHPLKSGQPRSLPEVGVLARGFVDDRSWMVVDDAGVLVSAREERRLLTIRADTALTLPGLAAGLRLSAPGATPLDVQVPHGPTQPVRLHGNALHAVAAGAVADAWLGAVLGRDDVHLVWCDDPSRRQLNPLHSRPGDHTAFADGYPVTLASEASLAQLNEWIAQTARERGDTAAPLPMQRFRPSLVINGTEPFAEDAWTEVTVGACVFRVAQPVDRCVMTTVDPPTLASGAEPIRTLARHRLSPDRKTLFAVHLIPLTAATIRVGDPVSVR